MPYTTRDILTNVYDATNNVLNTSAVLSVADVVTVTGGAGQTADVKVTLDSETVTVGSITAGDNNIGNVDVASIAAGTNSIGGTKDNGPHWTSVFTYTTSADMTTAADLTAAPSSGQKLVITDIVVSADTAMSISFQEETAGTVFIKLFLPANGSAQITPRSKLKLNTADKKLQGDASVAGNISVTVWYYSEAA